jgi:hypothetical protein
MKNSLSVISSLVLLFVLIPSCSKKNTSEAKEDVINDYLPLKVGAKYKYDYMSSYGYIDENSVTKGQSIWTFTSKSTDEPVIYQVEQYFSGYTVTRNNYTGKKDSAQIESQIYSLSFEVLNSSQVAFNFVMTYWGESKVTFERFIRSDETETCFRLDSPRNRGCLRKDVGITNFTYSSCGNHCSSVSYSLIEGPY